MTRPSSLIQALNFKANPVAFSLHRFEEFGCVVSGENAHENEEEHHGAHQCPARRWRQHS